MGRWRPSPKSVLFEIKRYDRTSGEWDECRFTDLKPGDIYATFAPDGSHQIDPLTCEPAENDAAVSLCVGDVHRNEETGQGYRVEVMVGRLEDHLAAASN